jgi:hypothetical protein
MKYLVGIVRDFDEEVVKHYVSGTNILIFGEGDSSRNAL